MSEHERPDPRDRPADPAGTQPKVDPESLLPEPRDESLLLNSGTAVAPDPLPSLREPAAVPAEPAPVPRETQHTPRFQFLLGALLAVGAVALAAALAVALRPEPVQIDPAAGWSTWRPFGSDPVKQISSHVQHQYRLPSGRDLVLVDGGPMAFVGLPAQVVLEQNGNLSLLKGDGVMFRLCGAGKNCSISQGKPSSERMLLLRREALELALYTFRYIGGVDQAVVFLPPAPGQKQGVTALFRKDVLTPQLLRPLNTTLARRTPSVAGVESSPDASLVARLTQGLYTPRLAQQNADAGLYLVLKPVPTKPTGTTTATPPPAAGSSGAGTSTSTSRADPSKALTLP
jgi:hypothetical protein